MDTGRIGRLLPEFRSDISCFRRITPRINAMLWEPAGIPFNGVSRSDIGRKFSRNYPCSRPILPPPSFVFPGVDHSYDSDYWIIVNFYMDNLFSPVSKKERKKKSFEGRWKPWKRIIGEDRWTRFKVIIQGWHFLYQIYSNYYTFSRRSFEKFVQNHRPSKI